MGKTFNGQWFKTVIYWREHKNNTTFMNILEKMYTIHAPSCD